MDKNLIDEIFPKPKDLFPSEDKINKELMAAADEQKEEVLPNECIKCGEPLSKGQEGIKCMNCLL